MADGRRLMAAAYDVVVAGAGNAAMCAALAAQEAGARVLVLEKAPREARGGNTFFTGGAFRFPYGGLEDIRRLVPDLSEAEASAIDVGTYPATQFHEDLVRVSDGKAGRELVEVLATQALPTMLWMRERGVRWVPLYGRQAVRDGNVHRFWGGLVLEAVGGGPGLSDRQFELAEEAGIEVRYETALAGVILEQASSETRGRGVSTRGARSIAGVSVDTGDAREELATTAVVLACGGFEANAEMRREHLGAGWELAKVRGTEHNTGDGIRAALEAGAAPAGDWGGCHAVAWDLNAPETGNRRIGDLYQKHSYPMGIIVNMNGERFVDEGADFRNYTYAKYGREILWQPHRVAFQVFDSKMAHLLRDEYRIREATRAESETIGGLAEAMGIDVEGLERTVAAYNAAVQAGEFDPARQGGKRTEGITPPKSNWALPLDTPPYVGYAVTCGITFTFGGLRVDGQARVLDGDGRPIAGLYAAGELVGGLFYDNYAGGSGLMAGSVFGRIAGEGAARDCRGQEESMI
jgi:tricarballylate dehydrogenase